MSRKEKPGHIEIGPGEATSCRFALALSGKLDLDALPWLRREVTRILKDNKSQGLVLDVSGLSYLDSAGALALALVRQDASRQGRDLDITGLSPKAREMVDLVKADDLAAQPLLPAARGEGPVAQVGAKFIAALREAQGLVQFIGAVVLGLFYVLRHPRALRLKDVTLYMQRVGVEGLPIVGLVSMLLGSIMAFMSALQLKPFGATRYVANLVAVAMVTELGPIMTAILVAGRSGSAFAAEIGTMKVNQEVDALTVMGFNPVVFLALPKIIAAILVIPLLTLFGDFLAIGGGMLVGVLNLDLTVNTYVTQSMENLAVKDILTGMLKSGVFALLIGGIGCHRGFQVAGGAQSVGLATTSAVVAALFLIILTDSIFALIVYT